MPTGRDGVPGLMRAHEIGERAFAESEADWPAARVPPGAAPLP